MGSGYSAPLGTDWTSVFIWEGCRANHKMPRTHEIEGTWRLSSRLDRAADGCLRDEPTLGSDPVALITYTNGHFAAQFMKRDRARTETIQAVPNKTGAVDGYDAYWGTFRVREDGFVEHRLEAALTPANVGMVVLRRLSVAEGRLVIELETTTARGEPVTRTLTWEPVGLRA